MRRLLLALVVLAAVVAAGIFIVPEAGPRFVPLEAPLDRQVLDRRSGLVWQRCPAGMGTVSDRQGLRCTGEALVLDWPAALAYAKAYAERDGHPWRLPSAEEMNSIIDDGRCCYAMDPVIFPPFYWPAGGLDSLKGGKQIFFHTASPWGGQVSSGAVWLVDAVAGGVFNMPPGQPARVRLVRSDGTPPR